MLSRVISGIATLVLVIFPFALGQESADEPTVEVTYPLFEFPDLGCNMSIQHFRNSRAYILEGNSVSDSVDLRNGSFERPYGGNYESANLSWVQHPTAGDRGAVIVAYSWMWAGGSSSQADLIQVLACEKGHFIVRQQIMNDAHSDQAGVQYDARIGILTVRSVRYGSGAHCCPEKLDIVTFKWTGKSFQRIRWKTVKMPRT